MKTTNNPLLIKAKLYKTRVSNKNPITTNELELAKAFLNGDVSTGQAGFALVGTGKQSSYYAAIVKLVMRLASEGRLEIIK